MVEGPLISLLSTVQQVQGVQSGAGARMAASVPTAFLAMALGTFVTGTIVARDNKGNPILQTENGDLTLKSVLPLKNGTEVVLRIEGTGDNFKARIVTVDGRPLSQIESAPLPPEDSISLGTQSNTQKPAADSAPDPEAGLLRAILLKPAAELKTIIAQLQPQLPETELAQMLVVNKPLAVRVLAIDPEHPLTQPAPGSGPQGIAFSSAKPSSEQPLSTTLYGVYIRQGGGGSLPDSPRTVAPSVPTPAAENTITQAQIIAENQWAAAKNSGVAEENWQPRLLSAGRMEAKIIGFEKTGETVLQTPIGVLKLPVAIPASPHNRIVIQWEAGKTPPPPAAPEVTFATKDTAAIAQTWPTLDKLLSTLQNYDPALAAQVMQRAVPQAGPRLASGILFFLSALKGGDIRSWLGDRAVDLLESKGQGELIKRLGGELGLLRATFQEQPGHQWQSFIFPIMYQGEHQQARFFLKRERGGQDTGQNAPGTRFIVEVGLSALGDMQMDGFVRRKDAHLFFDLIVRTLRPLPDPMKVDIVDIFNNAAELTRFKGGMQFQVAKEFPVNPMEEIANRSKGVIA